MSGKQGQRERLDKLLVARRLAPTRAKAQAYIMAGDVNVDGQRVLKAGTRVPVSADITVAAPAQFVGRGAYKLDGALSSMHIDLTGRVCADVGACTGGFTDVMLQRGAARVYAIDVGYGQLDWKLRQDERVVVMERTNARHLTTLPEPVSFVAIDVSFISLRLILPAVKQWATDDVDIVALVKPQFEAGKRQVGKGGIVRDPTVHQEVLASLLAWCQAEGLQPHALVRSSITGSDGNVEFLVWLRRGEMATVDIAQAIANVVEDVDESTSG